MNFGTQCFCISDCEFLSRSLFGIAETTFGDFSKKLNDLKAKTTAIEISAIDKDFDLKSLSLDCFV